MSRQRLTRLNKQADPYTLGRDKENPPVSKYMTGDPSTWAEDVYPKHLWEGEKREETGHAAEANHDFGPSVKGEEHPGAKEASAIKQAKNLRDKAIKCVHIAERLFPGASEEVLEQQGFDLMELSPRAISATLERIASAEKSATGETEDFKKEASELLKTAKELLAAEQKKAEEEEEDCDEEEKKFPWEGKDAAKKMAELLVKKASSLVEASEYEAAIGNSEKSLEIKAAAEQVLAQAKKVATGDFSDLPAEMKAKKEAAAAPAKAEPAKVAAEKTPAEMTKEEKKAAAARLLEAAKKMQADAAALSGEDGAADSASKSSNENPSADKKPTEHPAEGAEEDHDAAPKADHVPPPAPMAPAMAPPAMAAPMGAPPAMEGMKKDDAAPPAAAAPGAHAPMMAPAPDHGAHPAAPGGLGAPPMDAMPMDAPAPGLEMDIDMVPQQNHGDHDLNDLFMSPEMKDAKEAYERAFAGGGAGGMGMEVGMETDEGSTSSRTASKKGAKSLGTGVKISAADSGADDLSKLWNCPPDVSHVFK